jgi:hypothetical protein
MSDEPRTFESSLLRDIRRSLFWAIRRNAGAKQGLTERVRREVGSQEHRDSLRHWSSELRQLAEKRSDERAVTNLRRLEHLLDRVTNGEMSAEDAESLVYGVGPPRHRRSRPTRQPSLVGLSIMYVSQHYNEVYYTAIYSDLLPDTVTDFIKSRVFVPRVNGVWRGTVGEAIEHKRKVVANSFIEPNGVVACEDLVGGNVSIMMRAVTRHDTGTRSHPGHDTAAVLFCFSPLRGLFSTLEMELFDQVVASHHTSIRLLCEFRETRATHRYLEVLAERKHDDTDGEPDALLRALVPNEITDNPVGSLMGVYCTEDADGRWVASAVRLTTPFLARQLLRGEAESNPLIELVGKLGQTGRNRSWRIGEEAWISAWSPTLLPSEGPTDCVVEDVRLSRPFGKLRENFEHNRGTEAGNIACDMARALLGQCTQYVSHLCSDGNESTAEAAQLLSNMRHILSTGQMEGACAEEFFAGLSELAETIKATAGEHAWLMAGGMPAHSAPIEPATRSYPTGLQEVRIHAEPFHALIREQLSHSQPSITNPPKTNTGEIGQGLWADPYGILAVLQKALGVTDSASFTYEPVSLGSAGTAHVILLSLRPLIGDRSGETRATRNVLVRLSTAFHEALVTEGAAALAAYARGASHHFKNALADAEWLFGRFPDRATATFEGIVMSSAQRRLLDELTSRALELRDEIGYLKRQADLFFWVMSPERLREAARAGLRRFDDITTEGVVRGIRLGLAHRGAQWHGSQGELRTLLDEVALCHRVMVDAVREGAKSTEILPRLQKTLEQHLGLSLTYVHSALDLGVSGIAAQIVEAAVVELVQNGVKAAMSCSMGARELSIGSEVSPSGNVIITVRNTASSSDMGRLRQRLERGRAATDMSGLWQLELLCRRMTLPQGTQVTLLQPSFGASDVAMTLEVGTGGSDVEALVH